MVWRRPGVGVSLEDQSVGVDDPIDGAVADGVGPDGYASLVEEAHHLAVDFRVHIRIAEVAFVDLGEVLVPRLVDPCGAGGGTAIHEDLRATGDESSVAEGLRWTGILLDLRERGLCGFERVVGAPEHADALV